MSFPPFISAMQGSIAVVISPAPAPAATVATVVIVAPTTAVGADTGRSAEGQGDDADDHCDGGDQPPPRPAL